MSITVPNTTKHALLNALRVLIDANGTAHVKIYTGPRPASGNPITTQILLSDNVLVNPCAPSASAGQLNLFNPVASANLAAGTAIWSRITDGLGKFILDCDVSVTAGSGEVKLSSTFFAFPGTTDISTIEFFIN